MRGNWGGRSNSMKRKRNRSSYPGGGVVKGKTQQKNQWVEMTPDIHACNYKARKNRKNQECVHS